MGFAKFTEKPLDRSGKSKLFFILPVVSGLFLGAGFVFPGLRILVWVAFLPLFFFLNSKNITFKQSFFAGFIAGFIFFGQVLLWVFEISPSGFTDIRGEGLNFSLLFLTWLTSAGFMACFTGFFSLGYQFLKRRSFWDIFLIPSLWIIFDYLRVWAYGIFISGTETLSGPHWTLGNLAYSLAQNQIFRLLAGVGGIYLVSFLVVMLAAFFFYSLDYLISRKGKVKIWYLAGLFVIIFLVSASYFLVLPAYEDNKDEELTVAVVQTKIPSSFSSREQAGIKNQIQQQLLESIARDFPEVDLVVLPEGSNFLRQEENKEYLLDLFGEKNVWIIDSGWNEKKKFVGFLYNPEEGISGRYEKRLLIPYGDYLPYVFKFISVFINEEWLEHIENLKGMRKGDELPMLTFSGKDKIGLFFCSEAISSDLHRRSAEKGGQLFLNAGSLAFSDGSKILDSQTLSMLQFRAAENGRYLARATNYGNSYILDNKGEIVRITNDLENQVILEKIQLVSRKTLYAKYGDWILILAGLILLTFLITCVILKNRENRNLTSIH